jgi:hypothetical protein
MEKRFSHFSFCTDNAVDPTDGLNYIQLFGAENVKVKKSMSSIFGWR